MNFGWVLIEDGLGSDSIVDEELLRGIGGGDGIVFQILDEPLDELMNQDNISVGNLLNIQISKNPT